MRRGEFHQRQDLLRNVNPRCDFTEHEALTREFEYRSFRDVENLLAVRESRGPVETHLLHAFHKFRVAPFAHDAEHVIFDSNLKFASGERATKHEALGILSDVHETATPAKRPAKEHTFTLPSASISTAPRTAMSSPPPS